MAIYRRQKDSDTWHWCRNCSSWPRGDYEERNSDETLSGELCNECIEKERAENCRK